jgi:hypothetical protein
MAILEQRITLSEDRLGYLMSQSENVIEAGEFDNDEDL